MKCPIIKGVLRKEDIFAIIVRAMYDYSPNMVVLLLGGGIGHVWMIN